MNIIQKQTIFILFMVSIQISFSQNDYKFDHLGFESGIPDAFQVRSMVQDQLGFLWFAGTYSLVKYDGYSVKVYEHNSNDSSSLIKGGMRSLFLDRENNLFVGTEYGISLYQRDKDNFINYYLFSEPNNNPPFQRIVEDKNGLIWFSTYAHGLFSFDKITRESRAYKHDDGNANSISSDSLQSIVIDNNNNIWISTLTKGMDKFDINKKVFMHFRKSINDSDSIGSDNTGNLYLEKSGIIWVGLDNNGFDEINTESNKFKHYKLDIDFSITSFYKDKSGLLWIATGFNPGGIILFDKTIPKYTLITNNLVRPYGIELYNMTIGEDNSGVIWIGTANQGLTKFIRQKQIFRHYKNALNPAQVAAIVEDNSSNIWIGTFNGLDKLNLITGQYTHFSKENNNSNSLSNNEVRALIMDDEGILWIGTGDGLNKLDINRNKFTHYYHNSKDTASIAVSYIQEIYQDSFGNLWIGTSHGLDKFEKSNTFKHYKYNYLDSASLGSDNVRVIYEDKNKALWIGAGGKGLSRFNNDNRTFKKFFDEQSIKGISSICEDNKNRLWVTSFFTGLNLFDRNTWTAKNYDKNFGLPTNYVCDMLTDNTGKIWLSTHQGLSCFDPEKETFRNFNEEDGLNITDFYVNAAYKSKNGTMYFGGNGGIVCFNPDSVIKNVHVPNIVLTDFKIFNESVLPSDNSQLKKHINIAEEINLSYKDNSFSFEFAALDFNSPKRNQYAYMMEGFDKDWINSGNIRTASYTNLDAGEYIFRVKGSNNDGIWNEQGTSIRILITPPWWQTWWFRGFFIMLILGGFGYVRQRKISKIRKEMEQQAEFSRQLITSQEQERKRIAGDLHDSLAQNLLVIKNRATLLLRKKETNNNIKEDLMEISNGLLSSMDEIRSITYSLRPHEIDRFGLTDSIKLLIEKIRESGNIDFEIHLDNIDNFLKQDDEVILYRIVQESLNNILKHSDAKRAEIKISKQTNSIDVIISDDGKGFDMEITTDQSRGHFGIKGLRERVNLLKGTFNIITSAKKGTIIQINIPVKDE